MIPQKKLHDLERLGCQYSLYYCASGKPPILFSNQERFLSASLIKVPILLAWLHLEQAGLVRRDDLCNLDAEPQVQGAGFSWLLRARQMPFQDVLLMMMALSDNLSTNLVIRHIGLKKLNEVIQDVLELRGAELQRKLFDYEARGRGLDNWITTGDCIRMYALIAALPAADRAWVESMMAVCQDNALLMRSIPRDTVNFYHKTGSITGVLHDWGYTDSCQMFLLTQNVPDEPAAFEVFGELGKLLMES